LGDLVLISLTQFEKNELTRDHPNSIGSKFIAEMNMISKQKPEPMSRPRKQPPVQWKSEDKLDTITKLVVECTEGALGRMPTDISESIVVHLRLGDVVAGNACHEKEKRPYAVEQLCDALRDRTEKKYVIGKCFFAKPSSKNYDECIQQSDKYMAEVLNALNATHLDGGDADIDLCCAVKAKLFVQGKGCFSMLITEIRKRLNRPTLILPEGTKGPPLVQPKAPLVQPKAPPLVQPKAPLGSAKSPPWFSQKPTPLNRAADTPNPHRRSKPAQIQTRAFL
jgi:hypothetical protein